MLKLLSHTGSSASHLSLFTSYLSSTLFWSWFTSVPKSSSPKQLFSDHIHIKFTPVLLEKKNYIIICKPLCETKQHSVINNIKNT